MTKPLNQPRDFSARMCPCIHRKSGAKHNAANGFDLLELEVTGFERPGQNCGETVRGEGGVHFQLPLAPAS